ncbi:MAG: LPS export ABC transporter ATP-binding protein [Rhodobacteraceae bacterium]|nr:LPS export ABC transporter ATP-binding protein [Paracoccaceae bacterium]
MPAGAEGQNALAAVGLSKRYRGFQAVADASFTVARGEIVSLMGPNGAGKTTLYRMLIGAEPPNGGRITLDGLDVTRLPTYARARCGLSYLPQDPSAFRGLSVADNIRLALENHEPDRAERAARLEILLEEMDLNGIRNHRPGQLSGGQRRRCEIARLLAVRPRYLLLDEPFTGLDPLSIGQVKEQIRTLAARGIGVLITDHNIHDTLSICDRTLVIAGGIILRDAAPAVVLDDPALRALWLGPEFAG